MATVRLPTITAPRVLVETAGDHSTTALCVTWELADSKQNIDGEWIVDWEGMDADSLEDVYLTLQRERDRVDSAVTDSAGAEPPETSFEASFETPTIASSANFQDEPLPTTANLIKWENGMIHEIGSEPGRQADEFGDRFLARPITRAQRRIQPDLSTVSRKTEVLLLLSSTTPLPPAVRVYFIPTWTPPNTTPTVLANIPRSSFTTGQGLHVAWAERRLEELKALEETARELELEGARGLTQGRLKIGVEGGLMDEKTIREESWEVIEEQNWVRERFLKSVPKTDVAPRTMLAGLGISDGLKLNTGSTVTGSAPSNVNNDDEDDDDDEGLFAIPISPHPGSPRAGNTEGERGVFAWPSLNSRAEIGTVQ